MKHQKSHNQKIIGLGSSFESIVFVSFVLDMTVVMVEFKSKLFLSVLGRVYVDLGMYCE